MENSFEIEGEFSDLIPNPAGIPGKREDSAKIRNGHSQWKKKATMRSCSKPSALSYWERASACNVL